MSVPLLLASLLALLTAVVHASLGGREVLRPVLAAPLRSVARGTIASAWHLLTWHFLVLAGLFAYGATREGPARHLASVVGGVQALGYALIFLVVTLRSFASPFRLPQWILFSPMALLALGGTAAVDALSPRVGDAAAVLAALVLVALSALHIAWAAGSTWPIRSRALGPQAVTPADRAARRGALARLVVGVESKRGMPGVSVTLIVAVALLGAAGLVLGARCMLPLPASAVMRALLWATSAVFGARGLLGFFDPALRPAIRGTPYVVWNARLYSPVALALGVSLAAAAASPI